MQKNTGGGGSRGDNLTKVESSRLSPFKAIIISLQYGIYGGNFGVLEWRKKIIFLIKKIATPISEKK